MIATRQQEIGGARLDQQECALSAHGCYAKNLQPNGAHRPDAVAVDHDVCLVERQAIGIEHDAGSGNFEDRRIGGKPGKRPDLSIANEQ
jgi:hypothetical protein